MMLLDRIRSLFTARPKEGQPDAGRLMERGGGEFEGPIDEGRESAHHHEFGAPNDTLEDHVRPPMS